MRGEEELHALEARLGAKVPPGISRLTSKQLQHLLSAIEEARHRQAAELQAAGDKAWGHVPRLLRGPIRRIMG